MSLFLSYLIFDCPFKNVYNQLSDANAMVMAWTVWKATSTKVNTILPCIVSASTIPLDPIVKDACPIPMIVRGGELLHKTPTSASVSFFSAASLL